MDHPETPALKPSVKRVAPRVYSARNERDAELTIGFGPGEFSPGDLLKLALLGCHVLSSDARFAHALGDDYALTGTVDASFSKEDDRFTDFTVELFPELGDMSPEDREQLMHRVAGAVRHFCTITHTLTPGAPTHMVVDGDPM